MKTSTLNSQWQYLSYLKELLSNRKSKASPSSENQYNSAKQFWNKFQKIFLENAQELTKFVPVQFGMILCSLCSYIIEICLQIASVYLYN